jgi:hypothetical protein
MKKIDVLIISLKRSHRQKNIKKNLKKLNIKYKIINAIDGTVLFKNEKKIKKIFDENFFNKKTGIKKLSPGEIGAAASHLKCYAYIIKNKIPNCIIMEDDCHASILLKKWINEPLVIKKSIISFYAYGSGFVDKKPSLHVLGGKISIHNVRTHIFSSLCYQINYWACKQIMSATKGKVTGYPDWPVNFQKEDIKSFLTFPYIARQRDSGFSYLEKARQNNSSQHIFKKMDKIYNFVSFFYYLSFLPFLFRKYKNLSFYNEYHFNKKFFLIKNFFSRKYLNLKNVNSKKNCYAQDLQNILE